MKAVTNERLDAICTEICDNICRWPHSLDDQQEVDEKCDSCQTMIDLVNLVESLEVEP